MLGLMHPILVHDLPWWQKLKAGDSFIGYSFALKFHLDFVSDSASGASSLKVADYFRS